jgi:hypothetical protein
LLIQIRDTKDERGALSQNKVEQRRREEKKRDRARMYMCCRTQTRRIVLKEKWREPKDIYAVLAAEKGEEILFTLR